MESLLKHILPFELDNKFEDKDLLKQFEQWDQPARYTQISIITFLTATFYLVFNIIDKPWISEELNSVIMIFHFSIVIPILLFVSYLAKRKVTFKILMPLLAIAPILTIAVHIFISSKIENNSFFIVEGYYVVFWVFIVSGMTLRYAIFSSFIIIIMLISTGYYILSETDFYLIYIFWIFCSFTFGLLTASILDRSRKSVFLTQMKLHKLAITDPLTGVYNRSVLNQVMAKELANESRINNSFGLILIDVDDFKSVNDTLGHEIGDKVIIQIAQSLSQINNENNTLVRWGGEEFVIIATKINAQNLDQFCNLIRKKIESASFSTNSNITISIGATLYEESDTQDSMLIRADNALYQAKDEGKNRVVIN